MGCFGSPGFPGRIKVVVGRVGLPFRIVVSPIGPCLAILDFKPNSPNPHLKLDDISLHTCSSEIVWPSGEREFIRYIDTTDDCLANFDVTKKTIRDWMRQYLYYRATGTPLTLVRSDGLTTI
jgi:hypothetical protein